MEVGGCTRTPGSYGWKVINENSVKDQQDKTEDLKMALSMAHAIKVLHYFVFQSQIKIVFYRLR